MAPTPFHVLIVDDDRLYRRALQRTLRRAGLFTTAAASVREALALISESPYDFDIVATDLVMPEAYGDVLLHHIAERWPHLPAVVLSSESGGFLDDEGGIDEANRFIAKDSTPHALIDGLRAAVAAHRASQPVVEEQPMLRLVHG